LDIVSIFYASSVFANEKNHRVDVTHCPVTSICVKKRK